MPAAIKAQKVQPSLSKIAAPFPFIGYNRLLIISQ